MFLGELYIPWRIIPVSKWLITIVNKSPRPAACGNPSSFGRDPKISLLAGMIVLQVRTPPPFFEKNGDSGPCIRPDRSCIDSKLEGANRPVVEVLQSGNKLAETSHVVSSLTTDVDWLVVSNIFYFHPYLGK